MELGRGDGLRGGHDSLAALKSMEYHPQKSGMSGQRQRQLTHRQRERERERERENGEITQETDGEV